MFCQTILLTISILVSMLGGNVLSSPFRVHSIEIFTSDCDDCGVGVFGEVSIKVKFEILNIKHVMYKKYYNYLEHILYTFDILLILKICGSGPLQCCATGSLNHLAENDFKPGESNTFDGDFIGTCDGFDLGETSTINLNNAIEIWHEGE